MGYRIGYERCGVRIGRYGYATFEHSHLQSYWMQVRSRGMGLLCCSSMASKFHKFFLHRNILIVASILCIVFAVLIVFENIIFCNRHCFVMVFTYLLAWMFFTCGLIGLKMSFIMRTCENAKSTAQLRRISPAPIWISEPQMLQVSQPPSLVLTSRFPPPPPAYNQINTPLENSSVRVPTAPPAYDRVYRNVYPQRINPEMPSS